MTYYYRNLADRFGLFDDGDRSFIPPEYDLLWRLDELTDRLNEMDAVESPRTYSEDCFAYSDDDIRYALPEFIRECDLEKAIDMAKDDLLTKYGIDVSEEALSEPAGEVNTFSMTMFCKTFLFENKTA